MSSEQGSSETRPFSSESAWALAAKLNEFRHGLEPEERALLSELISLGEGRAVGEGVSNFQEAVHRVLEGLTGGSLQVEQLMPADGMWAKWAAADGGG